MCRKNVSIPRRSQVDVPVRLAWTADERDVNNNEGALDPRQVCHGVMVARSLLPRVESKTFVRAINLYDELHTLSAESCMRSSWPVEVVGCGSAPLSPTRWLRHQTPHPSSNDLSHVYPVVGSSADFVVLEDKDWGDAAVKLQLFLEEHFGDITDPPVAAGREVFSILQNT